MVEVKTAPISQRAAVPAKVTLAQRLLLVSIVMMGVVFQAAAIVFLIGMLPTFVAFLADGSRDKTRAFTVALLNFVTCFHFVMGVALDTPTIAGAIDVVSNPLYIVVMYGGAAAGYFLDWALTGISNIVMTGRARLRLDAIKKRQEELILRWGREVTGDIPLDVEGYPIDAPEK